MDMLFIKLERSKTHKSDQTGLANYMDFWDGFAQILDQWFLKITSTYETFFFDIKKTLPREKLS